MSIAYPHGVTVLHHNDFDGLVSAYFIHRHLVSKGVYDGAAYGRTLSPDHGDIFFKAVNYGDPVPTELVTGRTVFVVDFSFSPEETDTLAELAAGLVVIDHHKTSNWMKTSPAYVEFSPDIISEGRDSLAAMARAIVPAGYEVYLPPRVDYLDVIIENHDIVAKKKALFIHDERFSAALLCASLVHGVSALALYADDYDTQKNAYPHTTSVEAFGMRAGSSYYPAYAVLQDLEKALETYVLNHDKGGPEATFPPVITSYSHGYLRAMAVALDAAYGSMMAFNSETGIIHPVPPAFRDVSWPVFLWPMLLLPARFATKATPLCQALFTTTPDAFIFAMPRDSLNSGLLSISFRRGHEGATVDLANAALRFGHPGFPRGGHPAAAGCVFSADRITTIPHPFFTQETNR